MPVAVFLELDSDLVVVVVGPHGPTQHDDRSRPRLCDPRDPLRIEVSLALALGKRVIPVLFSGTPMLAAEEFAA